MTTIKTLTAALVGLTMAAPAAADLIADPTGRDWYAVRTNVNCGGHTVNAAKLQRGQIVYLIEAGADCPRADVVAMPAGLHPFKLDEVQEAVAEVFPGMGLAPSLARTTCEARDIFGDCTSRDRLPHTGGW